MEVPAETQTQLVQRCRDIRDRFKDPDLTGDRAELASEVLVFPRSVELAIEFGQFYKAKDIAVADELLDEAENVLHESRRVPVGQRSSDGAMGTTSN